MAQDEQDATWVKGGRETPAFVPDTGASRMYNTTPDGVPKCTLLLFHM